MKKRPKIKIKDLNSFFLDDILNLVKERYEMNEKDKKDLNTPKNKED